MLKMSWYCSDCEAKGELSQDEMIELNGCCPNCMHHKGNIEYYCDLTLEQFLEELSTMTASALSKYALVINECAYDLKQNL